jgi:hypothetical protein
VQNEYRNPAHQTGLIETGPDNHHSNERDDGIAGEAIEQSHGISHAL